jgi:hypothetical protein
VKQFSSIFLFIVILFIAAILYILTKQPRDVTLKDILRVNPPLADTQISREEPVKSELTPIDSIKTAVDDTVLTDYYIIVGSARDPGIAQQKAEKLKNDSNIHIIVLPLSREGIYRISYGKYSTLETARSAMENIRRNIRSDAWIYSIKK